MSGIGGKFSIFVIGASALAMASGCATTEQQARVSTYGAPAPEDGVYTGADRVFADGHMDELRRAGAASSIERPDAALLAAYEGVEGARLAHRVFGEARAEALDGACEQYVKIGQGETLYDIASYCDVPVTMLISANPVVHNPRHVEAGQIVEVPQLFNAQRHAMGGASAPAGVQFASMYVVQPGDSLNEIAARHLVSSSSIANLNPGVDWQRLPVGMQVRLPAVAAVAAPGKVSNAGPDYVEPPVVAPAEGYPYGHAPGYAASDEDGYVPPAEVTNVMPYASTPTHAVPEDAVSKSLLLTVDRTLAKPGELVTVSAVGLPANSSISLYAGPNGGDLRFIKSVTTDSSGAFSEPLPIYGGLGGVIFRATVDSTGKQLQSPRVGVDKIKPAE